MVFLSAEHCGESSFPSKSNHSPCEAADVAVAGCQHLSLALPSFKKGQLEAVVGFGPE